MSNEMTKKCAEAMGIKPRFRSGVILFVTENKDGEAVTDIYDPLHDDEQAMALLKHFDLGCDKVGMEWHVWRSGHSGDIANANLNRAIVECVSKMVKP